MRLIGRVLRAYESRSVLLCACIAVVLRGF